MITHPLFCSSVILLGSAALLPAATLINLDWDTTGQTAPNNIGPFSGTGPLGGGVWNNPQHGRTGVAGHTDTQTNLLDSTGLASTVGVSVATFNNTFDAGNQAGVADTVDPLFSDFLYLNGGQTSATITFSGLGAGTEWNIVLFGANGNGQGSVFNIGGTSLSTTDAGGILATPTAGDEYVQFNNIVANGSGVVTVTWTINSATSGGVFGAFNGFQLQQVPEPSTALLGGLGLLALLRRRR